MKRRIACCVGCNDYTYLSKLYGACNDASRLFESLLAPNFGGYDTGISKLLLSPSLDEFRQAVNAMLFQPDGVEVFTLIFAGHGGVKSGSYYLCLRDSRPDRLSATAYPLNALFTILNESRPTQANIIIDACNAGGLVTDLGTLLKPDVIGARDSPSVSLLASSSSDEYANETNEGGVVSNLIQDYLTGAKTINSTSPYLDLSDIGKHVSQTIDALHRQTPTWWGLNLYGQSKFSKNPHFSEDALPFQAGFGEIPPASRIGKKIGQYADLIWDEFRSIGEEPEPYRLARTLERVIGDFSDDPGSVATFIGGIANTLEQQAVKSRDLFGPVTVVSVLLVSLLKFVQDPAASAVVTRLLQRRRELLIECVKTLIQKQDVDKYYLLGPGHGIAELFLLPIRVLRVLGCVWSQVLIDAINGEKDSQLVKDVSNLTRKICIDYAGSLVAVSDTQAPYLYVAARGAERMGLQSIIADVINSTFMDVVRHKGSVADAHIESSDILQFLVCRHRGKERVTPQILANPSQLVAVLLSVKVEPARELEWNKHLRTLDRQGLGVFIPTSLRDFGALVIREGVNNSFKIGHGIWSLEDFRREFAGECCPAVMRDESWRDVNVQTLSVISSQTFPDRIPWFLDCSHAAS